MADVRALLRAEQAARGTTSKPSQPTASTLGKRKAVLEDDQASQKRSRAQDDHVKIIKRAGEIERLAEVEDSSTAAAVQEQLEADSSILQTTTDSNGTTAKAVASIDEDEWAAFERDVASPPASPPRQSALNAIQSNATISAAPRSREEIEAQKKEDSKTQRAQREEDIVAEQEEAARNMEDEFEEMEALEARVLKLKNMRETIRLRNTAADNKALNEDGPGLRLGAGNDEEDEDDDDDDDEADYDDWQFGKR